MIVGGLVLAAGVGSRIATLSRFRPKPLFPVGLSTPFARAVDALRAGGATAVVANASWHAEQVVEAGCAIDVGVIVEEGGPHGTAAGVAGARDRMRDSMRGLDALAIWNGDIVAPIEVKTLVDALDRDGDASAVLAVHGSLPVGEGNVGVDEEGRVVRLRNRSMSRAGEGTRERRGAWFSAVHVMRREVVARTPARGCLVGDLYLPMLDEGARLVAVQGDYPWDDVGDLASYLRANVRAIGEATALIGANAHVAAGVTLDRAVIGERGSVVGEGVLGEVIAWPGARVRAPLQRAVVVADAVISIDAAAS